MDSTHPRSDGPQRRRTFSPAEKLAHLAALSWDVVPVDKPDDVNVVIGQAHFIKTVEDLHEALAGVGSSLRFGLAFCEASGPRLVRRSGNDPDLVGFATRTALAIAAGRGELPEGRRVIPVHHPA